MNNRRSSKPAPPPPATERRRGFLLSIAAALLLCAVSAWAGSDAPAWMHAVVNLPLPAHDEKTNAVLLYSETDITVVSADKIRRQERRVYKILRPDGRGRGLVRIDFRSNQRITSLHAWCIPAEGKDYEANDKDAVDIGVSDVDGSELVNDVRERVLQIPAPDPGNIVGYEYEMEERPFLLQDEWDFQRQVPVAQSHYSLQLPAGWEYKASWMNYPEAEPTSSGANQWQWAVSNVPGLRPEPYMPPYEQVAGQMIISFLPTEKSVNGFTDWRGMGTWYSNLTQGRRDASPQIRQQVATLTADAPTVLQKMRAIADFVQHSIRYVAIELGIGGWQPHPAADIFSHRYGDCKDKATLMSSMLQEIGVDSFYVLINTERGAITSETPANHDFDHAILAIKLPDGVNDASLTAVMNHPKLGRLLFFDPTDEMTPFGRLSGSLQANYGLLVTPDGGELVELPEDQPKSNSIERTAKFSLDPSGTLHGEVTELRLGDRAWEERWRLRAVARASDRVKPIEDVLSGSLSGFHITAASVVNLHVTDRPFGFNYSFESENYAKSAGNLLLVRPAVLGRKEQDFLETKDPRLFPIEFDGPRRDVDDFEISIPPGYVVDDLPAPVNADYGFASYHSKAEVKGDVIAYNRTFEVKELSVPVSDAAKLKQFYRIIAGDERNAAVLRPAGK